MKILKGKVTLPKGQDKYLILLRGQLRRPISFNLNKPGLTSRTGESFKGSVGY